MLRRLLSRPAAAASSVDVGRPAPGDDVGGAGHAAMKDRQLDLTDAASDHVNTQDISRSCIVTAESVQLARRKMRILSSRSLLLPLLMMHTCLLKTPVPIVAVAFRLYWFTYLLYG